MQLETVTRTQGNNQALKDGSVRPDTFEFDFEEVDPLIAAFRRMVRGLEFDICEMAITTYICAKAHGKRMTAVPVFLVRAFHHGAILVNSKAGIATPKFWTVTPDEDIDADQLTYPVFVKPARSGSSFGVTKVSRREELQSAVQTARQYDSKVVIEEAVLGSEVGCAIHGNGLDLFAGEVDQIALSDGFFRIHQEREPERGSDNATVIVPANISPDSRSLVQETAKAIYRALGCSGLARVDMFLTDDGRVVLNEVNTLPGMTSYSRYPRMMAAAGLPFAEVIDRIVSLTLTETRR